MTGRVVVVNKLHGVGFVARRANAGGLYELGTTMGTRVEPAPGGEWQHNPRVCSSYPPVARTHHYSFIKFSVELAVGLYAKVGLYSYVHTKSLEIACPVDKASFSTQRGQSNILCG